MKTLTEEQKKARIQRIIDQAFKFRELVNAETFIYEMAVGHNLMLVLGDDERYWAVSPADAQRLERAGYELA